MNAYNFDPPEISPTCSSEFELNIVNTCFETIISSLPTEVDNFVTFAGFAVTSLVKCTFNDTESIAKTLTTDESDYCSEKVLHFKLNETENHFFTTLNDDFITFQPPSATKDFGVAQA